MPTELLKALYAAGIGQSLLLASILLLPRSESRLARRALATLLVAMGLVLWSGYVSLLGPGYEKLRIPVVLGASVWLIGPSIWLYVCGLTRGSVATVGLHLLPAGLVFLVLGLSAWMVQELPAPLRSGIMLAMYAQVTAYIALSLRELLHHRAKIKANLSDLGGQSLTWLNILVGAFLMLWILDFSVVVLNLVDRQSSVIAYHLLMLVESAWMLLMAFVALRQPDILHRQLVVEPLQKYRTSALSQEAAAELGACLDSLMKREKPHLENELTLPQLAKQLGVTPHLLSQLLNDNLGCNFYEFTNKARVREAQAMLRDSGYDEIPIIDIAYQSGFNNKNSFNRAFRKFTSVTPSEFRRGQLN